ncbi:hypothetical protein AXF42_Ash009689 [Apostasia shenzhenica]|uniref:Uncharacterized protein n=1 Tax=Apostasia shenzhenica TaxID=1088818 RepID=A0A2I0AWT3_9ASPA|nr:hypothetical protein AXF42_Ash009689 [Apostasia shenzhenica]
MQDRYQEAISRQCSNSYAQQESFDADAWCEATGQTSRGKVHGSIVLYASQHHIETSRYYLIIEEEVQRHIEIACLDLKATINAQHEQQDKILAELREMRELLRQAYRSRATVPESDHSPSGLGSSAIEEIKTRLIIAHNIT